MGFIKSVKEIVMFLKGKSYKVSSESKSFEAIDKMLENGATEDELLQELDASQKVKKISNGFVDIIGEQVFFKGEQVPNDCGRHILQLHESGEVDDRFILFLENLMLNPNKEARKDLYTFILKGRMPITQDGHFCAYRVVSSDWKDKHTGTMDNSIGATPKMDRSKCDSNRDNTCSSGLHFCSRDYIGSFYSTSDHLVMMKINPRDVVSIPSDYNDTKGRCCEFLVLKELDFTERIEGNIIDTREAEATLSKPDPEPIKVDLKDIKHKELLKSDMPLKDQHNAAKNSKECSSCHQVKPLSEFSKRADSKDGYQGRCKACINAKRKAK